MPIPVSFTDKQLLQGTIVEPAWYTCMIENIGEKPTVTPKGPSTNYPMELIIIRNGDNGDLKFKDVPVTANFNSGAMGFTIGLFKALGVDEVKANERYDLKSCEGKMVDVYIENGLYNGRTTNRIEHKYRPVKNADGL